MNEVKIEGTLTREPELRYTPNGHAVCKGNLRVPDAGFHTVIAWNKLAEQFATCEQGETVRVKGTLRQRSYEIDGSKRYAVEIIADRILMPEHTPQEETEEVDPFQDQPTQTYKGKGQPFGKAQPARNPRK